MHRRIRGSGLVLLLVLTLALGQASTAAAGTAQPESDGTTSFDITVSEPLPYLEGKTSPGQGPAASQSAAGNSAQTYNVDADQLPDDGTTAPTPVSDGPTITYNECAGRVESRTPEGWAKNHFQWCRIVGYTLTEKDAQDKPIGSVKFNFAAFGYSNNLNRKTDYSFMLKGFKHFDSTVGRVFDFQVGGRSCTQVAASAYQRQPDAGVSTDNTCSVQAPIGSTWRSETEWKSSGAFVGQQMTSIGGRLPDFTARPAMLGLINAYENGLYLDGTGSSQLFSAPDYAFRCDSATYIKVGQNSYPEGCVFQVVANLQYDLANGKSYEAANHIQLAQQQPELTKPEVTAKFIPGARNSGSPLSRNYYGKQGTASRVQKVCNQFWPGYSTHDPAEDCDEYPFASTYQNAIYTPNSYSAKAINASQNRSAGGQLNAFYARDRMLDEDTFYVEIIDSRPVQN